MNKKINAELEFDLNTITVNWDGRTMFISPTKDGIHIKFQRELEPDEKEAVESNKHFVPKAAESTYDGGVLVTRISITYEAAFLLSDILMNEQRLIRTLQIGDAISIGNLNIKREIVEILLRASDTEFMSISDLFGEDCEYTEVKSGLDTIKKRLCLDGILEQSSDNVFGN